MSKETSNSSEPTPSSIQPEMVVHIIDIDLVKGQVPKMENPPPPPKKD